MRWVSRSQVGWSLASLATGNAARAVRATASCPLTNSATISIALGGLAGASAKLLSAANCA